MRRPCQRGFILMLAAAVCAISTSVRADVADFPIVITGAELPSWAGRAVGEIYVLTYDAGADAWSAIPYQVDERRTVLLQSCLNLPFNVDAHLSYVFSGSEGNGLDGDDEIVFLTGDALGDAAPPSEWPAGVDDLRYEVTIDDGMGAPIGTCYLFTAGVAPLPPDATNYVQYAFMPITDVLENTTATGVTYRMHYAARWRIDELAVSIAGGGADMDLIDRIKRREGAAADGTGGEDEELWDETSCFLGHRAGPVRAIREVQGAASGVNTTYTMYFYAAMMVERINLRVHAIPSIMQYVDYDASAAPLTYYNAFNPAGVAIDGAADPAINMTLADWEMVSHATLGGVFYHRAQPAPPPAASQSMFYFDNGAFADSTGDDEPGRYGCHGIVITDLATTDPPGSEAVFVQTMIPLPAGTGNVGAALAGEVEFPPFGVAMSQTRPDPLAGDFDGDGDVDLADFAAFGQCFGGSGLPPAPGCPAGVDADLDGDGDVDLSDFAIFAQNFTGAT